MIFEFTSKLTVHEIALNILKLKQESPSFKNLFRVKPSIKLENNILEITYMPQGRDYIQTQFVGDFSEGQDKDLILLRGVLKLSNKSLIVSLAMAIFVSFLTISSFFQNFALGILLLFMTLLILGAGWASYDSQKSRMLTIIQEILQTTSFKVIE